MTDLTNEKIKQKIITCEKQLTDLENELKKLKNTELIKLKKHAIGNVLFSISSLKYALKLKK